MRKASLRSLRACFDSGRAVKLRTSAILAQSVDHRAVQLDRLISNVLGVRSCEVKRVSLIMEFEATTAGKRRLDELKLACHSNVHSGSNVQMLGFYSIYEAGASFTSRNGDVALKHHRNLRGLRIQESLIQEISKWGLKPEDLIRLSIRVGHKADSLSMNIIKSYIELLRRWLSQTQQYC